MAKKNRAIGLVLGIVVGLFLTACAGVVSGKIDMLDNANVAIFSPGGQVMLASAIEFETVSLAPVIYERANLIAAHKAMLQATLLESAAVDVIGGLCSRP